MKRQIKVLSLAEEAAQVWNTMDKMVRKMYRDVKGSAACGLCYLMIRLTVLALSVWQQSHGSRGGVVYSRLALPSAASSHDEDYPFAPTSITSGNSLRTVLERPTDGR